MERDKLWRNQGNKEKKMKKLRRTRIWPSVVFFVLSVLLTMVASVSFMALIVGYFAGDRIGAVYSDAMYVCQMFSGAETEEETGRILKYLEENSTLSDAVYILDGNKEILAGFGGATFEVRQSGHVPDLGVWADEPINEHFIVYRDSSESYGVVDEDGDFDAGALISKYITELLERGEADDGRQIPFGFGQKEVLFEVPLWIGDALSGDRAVIVKCSICFYESDFSIAVLIAGLSCLVMFLPLLFLFINLLVNCSNQKRMTRLLYTDPVTAGNSWLYFEHQADKQLRAGGNAGKLFSFVDITLMRYRGYCTYHGVKEGEALLEKIDGYLKRNMKSGECSAHYGKASFVLLLKGGDEAACEDRVRVLLEGLSEMASHGGIVFHAGIYYEKPNIREGRKTPSRRQGVDIAEAYNRASSARASLTDENQMGVAVFDQKLLEEQLWEHKVEEKMQQALDREEFQVYIQPKYNPVTEKLAGAEALVRWISEEDGFISPGRFIPIFEKNGFITKLDDYMISHVAKLQAEWLAAGKEVVPISVNVSRAHFANPDLAQHICGLVDAYQLPHHLIEIELTESAFFDDKEALLSTVRQLKELGFDISMDDFGAGYSSLNSLKDLPLDVLKLDAEFFRGEDGEERGEIVVSQAINLAKKLNMRIVAEGVEKKNQVEFLAAHDCDMIQGFYFAKPMPAGEYESRLERKN